MNSGKIVADRTGRVDGTGQETSKVLQEVLADLKMPLWGGMFDVINQQVKAVFL